MLAIDEQVNLVNPAANGANDTPIARPGFAVADALANEFAASVVEGAETGGVEVGLAGFACLSLHGLRASAPFCGNGAALAAGNVL